MIIPAPLHSNPRLLLGPGPSNVSPSVLEKLALPLLGHLDPAFVTLMEESKAMLREVYRTQNDMTFPVSGTGSAGMEFCFVNLIEPGDKVLIGVNGVFGNRMVDLAKRCGAEVIQLDFPWGQIVEPSTMIQALKEHQPKVVAFVHAETSTGALSPVTEIAEAAQNQGTLVLLDTVTSLGGCPVNLDAWQIDAVYSGTQKCLSCPPGLSPVSLSPRALQIATTRKTKVQSWYLDVNLLSGYWGSDRIYHHTAPISMNYAFHEALRLVLLEGLENRWKRHQLNHNAFKAGLQSMNLSIASQTGHQLWQLNSVAVPNGVDEAKIRGLLLKENQIEIGAGLGPLKGKVWRVGLMGESSRREHVLHFLECFSRILNQNGYANSTPEALQAASSVY